MSEIKRWLEEHDPLQSEPERSAEEAKALRRSILRNLPSEPSRAPFLTRLYLPAAALVAIVLAVLVAARWQLPGSQPSQTAVSESGPRISQVQFSTPGGTRIVWAFNPNLKF